MNNQIKIIERVIGVLLIISILVCSFGREYFNGEFVNYIFWFNLGLYLGFHIYKYQISKIIRNNK
ncbi:MAG: hypothetical protein Kow0079_16610 [Vicingaceae bacterium]